MKNKQETSMSVMRTWSATNPRRNPKIVVNESQDDGQGKMRQGEEEMKWFGSGTDRLDDVGMSSKQKLGILNWISVKKSHFEI